MTHPTLFLGEAPGPGRRSIAGLRAAIDGAPPGGFVERLWATVRSGAEASVGTAPLLPGTDIPGRDAEQIKHANPDNYICMAVAQRLLRDALVFLITGEERFRQDALTQLATIFDARRWPHWRDFAHARYAADLRTGQLGAAVALTYDWLYAGLSAADRSMIVAGLDRCAIRPFLADVAGEPEPHWLERHSNWQTVVVGGLGVVGMVLDEAHDQSERLVAIAQPRMTHYLDAIGARGEFNESVGYATAMQYAVNYWLARLCATDGNDDRLAQHPFPASCRWLMYGTVPPGSLIGFGDSHPRAPLRIGYFAAVAAATRDGVLQWFLETQGSSVLDVDPDAPTHLDAVDLAWYDPSLAATPPTGPENDAALPLGDAFPGWGGIVSSRSSWVTADAVVVSGKAGREPGHEHHDDGQLIIDAGDKSLIVDLGSPSSYPEDFFGENRTRYYNASVAGHNLLQFGERQMRDVKPRQGKFLFTEFSRCGSAWSMDLGDAYDLARDGTPDGTPLVRRSVVHLFPGVVVVLDECQIPRHEDIVLRWHTADRCEIDGHGVFEVGARRAEAAGLQAQICPLTDGAWQFSRGEHQYQPPFDRSRLDEPLHQRRESFVAAECSAASARILTLFVVRSVGQLRTWPAERRNSDTSRSAWSLAVAAGTVDVSVTSKQLTVAAGGDTLQVPLQPAS
jgi:hypothetical protein